MPDINLTDARRRDAVVSAQSVRIPSKVQYVSPDGQAVETRRVLKSTTQHDFGALVKAYDGDVAALGQALIAENPEVDFERFGQFLRNQARVYTDSNEKIVYRIKQTEIIRDPKGEEKSRRPLVRKEPNVASDIPLSWTGTMMPKGKVLKRFVFAGKMQIVHVNGLTYDFLFNIAKDLHDAESMMLVGGGESGKEPLIFRRGATPYRGFLEGRILGDKYILLLHLSNMELRVPAEDEA